MTSQPKLNIVVTGGSSGIGRSIVTRFASEGHNVLGTYFSNKTASEEITQHYKNVDFCALDQGCMDSVEEFTKYTQSWLKHTDPQDGLIDVLINNAALGSATVVPYVQTKLEEKGAWERLSNKRRKALEDEALMKVNALGPLWITEACVPMMRGPDSNGDQFFPGERYHRQSYSTVLFVGSVGGSVGVFPEYRASDLMSKCAVSYLSKHLAAEHIHSNIDVLCLAPGATNTEMFRKSTLEKCSNPPGFMNQMPKQRLLSTEEVADAVYFLCTAKCARIFHGGVLDASLGLGVRPGIQTEIKI